jgi:hypothetical protein
MGIDIKLGIEGQGVRVGQEAQADGDAGDELVLDDAKLDLGELGVASAGEDGQAHRASHLSEGGGLRGAAGQGLDFGFPFEFLQQGQRDEILVDDGVDFGHESDRVAVGHLGDNGHVGGIALGGIGVVINILRVGGAEIVERELHIFNGDAEFGAGLGAGGVLFATAGFENSGHTENEAAIPGYAAIDTELIWNVGDIFANFGIRGLSASHPDSGQVAVAGDFQGKQA